MKKIFDSWVGKLILFVIYLGSTGALASMTKSTDPISTKMRIFGMILSIGGMTISFIGLINPTGIENVRRNFTGNVKRLFKKSEKSTTVIILLLLFLMLPAYASTVIMGEATNFGLPRFQVSMGNDSSKGNLSWYLFQYECRCRMG